MREPGAYTRRRLERIADEALRSVGALGVVPTPLDAIAQTLAIDIAPIAALARPDGAPLLGALWFEERTLFVERDQSPVRRRFTEAHELMHALCPWHREVLRTDTAADLFGPTAQAIEAEANAGAGMLITSVAPDSRAAPSRWRGRRRSPRRTAHPCTRRCTTAYRTTVGGLPCSSPAAFRSATAACPYGGASGRPRSVAHVFRRRCRPARHCVSGRACADRAVPPPAAISFGGRRLVAEAHDNRHAVFVLLVG